MIGHLRKLHVLVVGLFPYVMATLAILGYIPNYFPFERPIGQAQTWLDLPIQFAWSFSIYGLLACVGVIVVSFPFIGKRIGYARAAKLVWRGFWNRISDPFSFQIKEK